MFWTILTVVAVLYIASMVFIFSLMSVASRSDDLIEEFSNSKIRNVSDWQPREKVPQVDDLVRSEDENLLVFQARMQGGG